MTLSDSSLSSTCLTVDAGQPVNDASSLTVIRPSIRDRTNPSVADNRSDCIALASATIF
jgi:hypothetical protein